MERKQHTDAQYEDELSQLRQKILQMGGLVEEAISNSLKALIDRNSALADAVIEGDKTVDRMEMEIDKICFKILALRQPAASDLRFIATALKIVTDLERVGDESVNISERARELNEEPMLKPYIDLPKMASITQEMLKDALDAFVSGNLGAVRQIFQKENEVDDLNQQLFRELLTFMLEDSHNITRCIRLSYISKYLERIADHTVNIAQMVIFLYEGEDVRHHGSLSS